MERKILGPGYEAREDRQAFPLVSTEQFIKPSIFELALRHFNSSFLLPKISSPGGEPVVWSSKCKSPKNMKGIVQLDGLLFSSDSEILGVMNQILGTFAINTEVCDELKLAIDTVTHRRLDTVIVDWNEGHDPTRVVRATRKSSPNSNSTIVAIVGEGSETHALLTGTNFLIHRPANVDHATRCMRAAYGTMLQQRRRAARVPVNIPVVARVTQLGPIEARISDISIGGLALQCSQPLQSDWEISVLFPLPNLNSLIRASGKVVNANQTGRAGIRFSFIPEEEVCVLEDWLATELAKLENAELPSMS